MGRTTLIAGNWKMYKTNSEAVSFANEFVSICKNWGADREVAICAPFTQIGHIKKAFAGSSVAVGAQNMHFEDEGAFTGEISAPMLTDIGVDYVIIGHSERRQYFAETDETVNKKLESAFRHGLVPICCVGEVLEQRDAGKAFEVVQTQIEKGLSGLHRDNVKSMVIAYEPVWAIGTGRTATPDQAEEMCAFIRKTVESLYDATVAGSIRIQYGGSVKPNNASELMGKENIDGALVGGASLIPAEFKAIVEY